MAIRLHHIPGSHVLDPDSYLLPVIYLADYLVSETGEGYGVDVICAPDHERILVKLEVDDDDLEKLHKEVKVIRKDTVSYYK